MKTGPIVCRNKGSDTPRTCGSDSVGAVRSTVRLAASHKQVVVKGVGGKGPFPTRQVVFGYATMPFLQACTLELYASCTVSVRPTAPKEI